MENRRLAVITSRSIEADAAWGSALLEIVSSGHELVLISGSKTVGTANTLLENAIRLPRNIRDLMGTKLGVSEHALQDFEGYRKLPGYAATHSTLLLMMSRVDSAGTFRGLEREVLVRRMNLEIFEALRRARPNAAIFDVTPHEAMDFALLKVLEYQKVPTLMFQPSLVGPQVMARSSLTEILPVTLPPLTLARHAKALSRVTDIADSAIDRLRQGTGTPKMDNQRAKESVSGSLPSRLRALRHSLNRLSTPGRDVDFSLTGHSFLPAVVRRGLEVFLERSLRRSLRAKILTLPNVAEAPEGRFAFMALHYEPERSSIPEGFPFDSQIDAIIAVRNLLPKDVDLVVKEHFSQQAAALRGFVGRSPDFYGLVFGLPGVQLVGPSTATRLLMKKAECVFTLTGKVGIEAAFESTPVIYLGQPWWGALPGSRHIDDVADYEDSLVNQRGELAGIDDWLSEQVREVLLPGVSSVPPERYTKRIASLPEGFESLEGDAIVAAFDALMAQNSKKKSTRSSPPSSA